MLHSERTVLNCSIQLLATCQWPLRAAISRVKSAVWWLSSCNNLCWIEYFHHLREKPKVVSKFCGNSSLGLKNEKTPHFELYNIIRQQVSLELRVLAHTAVSTDENVKAQTYSIELNTPTEQRSTDRGYTCAYVCSSGSCTFSRPASIYTDDDDEDATVWSSVRIS